ncbi:MAG TPA: hypothetical protein VII45_00830 [Solirubrobacterales bacterium]
MAEGLGQLLGGNLLVINLQTLKEALVKQTPFLRPGAVVGPLNIDRQLQGQVEGRQYVAVLDIQVLDLLGRPDALSSNTFLLGGK